MHSNLMIKVHLIYITVNVQDTKLTEGKSYEEGASNDITSWKNLFILDQSNYMPFLYVPSNKTLSPHFNSEA